MISSLRDHILMRLDPNRKTQQYEIDEHGEVKPLAVRREDLITETVAYYQTARFLFFSGGIKGTGDYKIVGFEHIHD